jgi:acyl carrier protein
MSHEEIAKKVKDIIVDKLGAEESEVTETANFTNDLGADSLDTVELIMEFERVFGIKIPDEDGQIATVGDAIKYVESKVNAAE